VENQWQPSKGKTTTMVTYPKETIHYKEEYNLDKTIILDFQANYSRCFFTVIMMEKIPRQRIWQQENDFLS
jgi:hypothetical protein